MELGPGRDVDWFVLDERPVLFQERHQKIIALDQFASLVWQVLWPDGDFRRSYSPGDASTKTSGTLASCVGCSHEQAVSFVEQCLEQWRASHLVCPYPEASAEPADTPLNTVAPQHMDRKARDTAQFCRFQLNGITISIERNRAIAAAVGQVIGHLPNGNADEGTIEVLVQKTKSGFRARDASGQSTLLDSPDEVVAWLKMAILDAGMEHRPSAIAAHAAALAYRGNTMMLVGGSGSGKSTLAACLGTQGFSLIGEDVVFIDPASGTIGGLPLSFAAKEGSWSALRHYFPEIVDLPVRVRPDGKRVKYLRPPQTLASTPIASLRSVVFPTYFATAATLIRRMSKTTALVEILKEALNPGHALTKSGFRTLCLALSRATVMQLTYSDLGTALYHIQMSGLPERQR